MGLVDPPLGPDMAERLLEDHLVILELMSRAAPIDQLLTALVTKLEGVLPGSRCSILLLDKESGRLRHGAAPSLPPDYVAAIDGQPIGPLAGSCGTAAFTRMRVVAEDIEVDPRWADYREIARAADLGACWSSPILAPDRSVVGTFAVYHDAPHRPGPGELELIDRYTHLAAIAIEHARVLDDLVRTEAELRSRERGRG